MGKAAEVITMVKFRELELNRFLTTYHHPSFMVGVGLIV
jgi:hypothetical protein